MTILTKNVEIDDNPLKESLKAIYDERVQVVGLGSEYIVYNRIFLIMSYKYNNNGFLVVVWS